MSVIRDQHGRSFRKLRISLLDACNYACTYCMPEGMHFECQKDFLSPKEIKHIVQALQAYGLEEVRLTGGEPLLRSDFLEVVEQLSELKLKRIGLTTNGHFLESKLEALKATKLKSLNISLDSLNRERFQMIAKRDGLERVLGSILKARALGFEVKLNAVIMRGLNHHELDAFVDFSAIHQIPVRFLEVMKIGVMVSSFDQHFVPAAEMIQQLKARYLLTPLKGEWDATAFNYRLDNGAEIGFIASESIPFCQGCSRLRLDPKGKLRACLMKNEGVNIRHTPLDLYPQILEDLLRSKPMDRIVSVDQPMHQIGG